MEHPKWFFAWTTGKPYITDICGWKKKDTIAFIEKLLVMKWERIYRSGGRILKCSVTPEKGKK
jgi:hypothetical protein